METYDEIELTGEETAEALRKGREEKHYKMERERYNASLRTERKFKRYTAEEYYSAFGKIFPINEEKEKDYALIVKLLCYYFSGDIRFNNPNKELNLKKGLLLFGGVGVGKTTLMQMFQQNQAYSYCVVSCRDVESEYTVNGADAIHRYSINQSIAINSNPYGQVEIGYCFDDLGTENPGIKHFGNTKNVMTDILLNRYDNKTDPRSTHLTTNLSVDEIESTYGTRVLDRMREVFNIIGFDEKAKSRR